MVHKSNVHKCTKKFKEEETNIADKPAMDSSLSYGTSLMVLDTFLIAWYSYH